MKKTPSLRTTISALYLGVNLLSPSAQANELSAAQQNIVTQITTLFSIARERKNKSPNTYRYTKNEACQAVSLALDGIKEANQTLIKKIFPLVLDNCDLALKQSDCDNMKLASAASWIPFVPSPLNKTLENPKKYHRKIMKKAVRMGCIDECEYDFCQPEYNLEKKDFPSSLIAEGE